MKALSIRQPWAWLILRAGKDIENRDWSTARRGRFLIHAAKGMTRDEYLNGIHTLYDEDLYPNWQRFERPHLADGGRKRTEVLWLNAAASAALDRSRVQPSLLT